MSTPLALTPHHDGSALYVSTAAPALGDHVRVRIRIPEGFGPVIAVHTRSNPDHEPRFAVASPVADVDGWEWWEAKIENPVHGHRYVEAHPKTLLHRLSP
ncbi:hypothetical protein [Lacisediminihabitans sp. H27-G8]|uniref:hypothetical protein n=1 Tax=Lacisediminihabitans sp. H27-G8 TaxID=3111909 RepID=UPI0038FD13A1